MISNTLSYQCAYINEVQLNLLNWMKGSYCKLLTPIIYIQIECVHCATEQLWFTELESVNYTP